MAKAGSTKSFSIKQEKMVADILGGYAIGGSGAMPTAPGDVKTYDWLMECKTHTSPDHNIFFDKAVWDKIQAEAMATHRKPVLIVDDGSQTEKKTWCLCLSDNINKANLLLVDFPFNVRKNITAKHDKLKEAMDSSIKTLLCDLYYGGTFELEWEGQTVCVMPLSTFKEVIER